MPAANWRFGAMAAVARRKGSAKLKGSSPQKMYPMLPLRQAAGTLAASGESGVDRVPPRKESTIRQRSVTRQ